MKLQGRDAQISAAEMVRLTAYVDSLTFPPNPNRNLDGTLRTALVVQGGTGNAVNGQTLFNTAPLFGPPPGVACITCHAGPDGTDNRVDIPGPGDDQNKKNSPLRDAYRKVGADKASQVANRGFGFDHDGEEATLRDVLNVGFNFPGGGAGQQQRRDIEAFMLSFGTDTFAGVGAQTTASNGGGAGDDSARITQLIGFANAGQAGLVVKGHVGGIARGFVLQSGVFQSDRAAQVLAPAALLALAAPGSELTYTLVPADRSRASASTGIATASSIATRSMQAPTPLTRPASPVHARRTWRLQAAMGSWTGRTWPLFSRNGVRLAALPT